MLDLLDFWTPWELCGSFYALDYLDWFMRVSCWSAS